MQSLFALSILIRIWSVFLIGHLILQTDLTQQLLQPLLFLRSHLYLISNLLAPRNLFQILSFQLVHSFQIYISKHSFRMWLSC